MHIKIEFNFVCVSLITVILSFPHRSGLKPLSLLLLLKMLIPMQKPFLISTIIFKSNGNGNGNDYPNLAFLAHNGEGKGPVTIKNLLGTARER